MAESSAECQIPNITASYEYTVQNGTDNETVREKSQTIFLPRPVLAVTDEQGEMVHKLDGTTLIIVMALLVLTILTIWVFRAKRIRVCHSTGLAMLYGIIFGLVIKYVVPPSTLARFEVVVADPSYNTCDSVQHLLRTGNGELEELNGHISGKIRYAVGEKIVIRGYQHEGTYEEQEPTDELICQISGKAFTSEEGNPLQQSLVFDPEVFFFVLLPPIIFQAGYGLKKRHFFRNIVSLLVYAFVGTTISCCVVGLLMWGYTRSPVNEGAFREEWQSVLTNFGITVVPSLLFGALISATDPVTVLAVFHDLHADFDLFSLVFGESVMNDAVAIVLFGAVDEYDPAAQAEAGTRRPEEYVLSVFISILKFFGIFIGSFLLGVVMAMITALVMKMSKLREHPLLETSMFIILSYSTFVIAEAAGLTGIVAILFCGVMQSHYTYINLSEQSKRMTKEVFELLNFVAENFVFSYMGLALFTYPSHQWIPGFILFSFVAILVARVINIYCLSFLLNLGRKEKIGYRFQHMLVFAGRFSSTGLRGAIAFALAIRNTETEIRQLIFTTTLMIVIVTVFINGGLSTLALQVLKIKVNVHDEDTEYNPEEDHRKGAGLVRRFARFDRKFIQPVLTHRGDLQTLLPGYCSWFVTFCKKCQPAPEEDFTQLMDEDGSQDKISMDTDADLEQEGTLVFQSQISGDIGLGDDPVVPPSASADENVEVELMTSVGDFPTQHEQSYA